MVGGLGTSEWDLRALSASAEGSRRVFDVSMPISPDMPVYKNKDEKRPRFEVVREHTQGARETRISLELHTGTHLDFPLHMMAGGATTDSHRAEDVVAPCVVLDLTGVAEKITAEDLGRKLESAGPSSAQGEWVLLKTRNSFSDTFDSEFVYLDESGAKYLAGSGSKGIGIDALGVERAQPGHETHKRLFERGIGIIEGLRLKDVPAGRYIMIAAPLKLVGVEAAPARVILVGAALDDKGYCDL